MVRVNSFHFKYDRGIQSANATIAPGYSGRHELAREEPSSVMQNWTLAIMHASTRDSAETIRSAAVLGYVYVSDVDEEKRKIKLLAPVSGRLGDRPMIWASWPEPYINLLG